MFRPTGTRCFHSTRTAHVMPGCCPRRRNADAASPALPGVSPGCRRTDRRCWGLLGGCAHQARAGGLGRAFASRSSGGGGRRPPLTRLALACSGAPVVRACRDARRSGARCRRRFRRRAAAGATFRILERGGDSLRGPGRRGSLILGCPGRPAESRVVWRSITRCGGEKPYALSRTFVRAVEESERTCGGGTRACSVLCPPRACPLRPARSPDHPAAFGCGPGHWPLLSRWQRGVCPVAFRCGRRIGGPDRGAPRSPGCARRARPSARCDNVGILRSSFPVGDCDW